MSATTGKQESTTKDLNIFVEHVTRVEGHGNIVVNMKDGKLEKSVLAIVEPPRYIEAMLKGRSWRDAHIITSRICGICSIGHQMSSLKATEAALNIPVSEQTIKLRKLLVDASFLSSHILHVYFLVAPDLVGAPSVFPLVATHTDVVLRALRMKRLANDICDMIGGRMIHPIRCVPGGFTMLPSEEDIKTIQKRLTEEFIPDAKATNELLLSVADKIPNFERETEYIALQNDTEYALYDGGIASTDTGRVPDTEYRSITNEFIVQHSSSKHAKHNRDAYMAGALARFNNNYDKLHPMASDIAKGFGMTGKNYNPYMNNIAQFIECVHCTENILKLSDEILSDGIKDELAPVEIDNKSGGTGVGCTEVPRGILFHEYTYDTKGRIEKANCIIPTGQNLENIDKDMEKLVPEFVNKVSKEELTLLLEMLVRAYDPCISCSVHMLDVQFVE